MFKFLKTSLAVLAFVLPASALAQGKIAVVNLQEAILQTDIAQKRLNEVRNQDDYKADKAEFDKLKGALSKRFEREVSMSSDVDGSLIGGAIIRAGDTVIDGSVRGRLDKLSETIQRT